MPPYGQLPTLHASYGPEDNLIHVYSEVSLSVPVLLKAIVANIGGRQDSVQLCSDSVINLWNLLPQDVVPAPGLDACKRILMEEKSLASDKARWIGYP